MALGNSVPAENIAGTEVRGEVREKNEVAERRNGCQPEHEVVLGFGWKWAENGSLWSEGRRWIEKGGGVGPTETGRDRCEYSVADGERLQLAAAGSAPRSSAAGRHYG